MTFRKGEKAWDGWTVVHALGGAALGFFPLGVLSCFALLWAYELFEGGLRRLPMRHSGKGLFEYESWPNIFVDVAVAWAAWGLVEWAMDGWPLPLW